VFLFKLSIHNFRAIKDMDIELQNGLNVLVGRNNTGKTAILDAIRFAIGPAGSQGDSLWLNEDDFYKESASTERTELLSVIMEFRALSTKQRTTFFEIVDFDLANIDNSRAILKFEASWPKTKRQASIKRTGGPESAEMPEVPHRILENISITYLPALRNAEDALAPGYKSRLATLLRDVAGKNDKTASERFVNIFSKANDEIGKDSLIESVTGNIREITKQIAGSDTKASSIRTAEIDFLKILRTLQIQMDDTPISSLSANGLGLNNLLYIAVILQHLQSIADDECPLLLVEEPEAHLHPQLVLTLSEYLSKKLPAGAAPQTFITTHSPTLVTSVPIDRMYILCRSEGSLKCNGLKKANLDTIKSHMFSRMMDITRSTLYFAKGIILVEGISESLLIPVLAKRLKYDLTALQISVIPLCGVSFEVFQKVLNPEVLEIPTSIITDGDPKVSTNGDWTNDTFDLAKQVSPRTEKLIKSFQNNSTAKVYHSEVTLEYDLADAGDNNAKVVAEAWESCFVGTPGTLNTKILDEHIKKEDKALAVWRGVCRAYHTGSKAELANQLAEKLSEKKADDDSWVVDFGVPNYIKDALKYVVEKVKANHA